MTDEPPSPVRAAAPYLAADELARLSGGRLLRASDRPVRGAAVDSRAVRPNELFVALPGEHTDGHRFIGAAVGAGAAAVLVSDPAAIGDVETLGDVTVVAVDDALTGLQRIAAGWRLRFDPLVVGITGSIAKTSTKEAVATVLAADRVTLKSEGNQNNEIGLPLTVLRLGPEHEAAVLEMGMYVGGEIRDLAAIGRPSIGVVTAVLGVHLSRIGTIDAVERAKGELVEALPVDGTAVLNADDPRVRRMASRTRARATTYGFADDADVRAEDVASAGVDGMRFTIRAGGDAAAARIPALGRLSVHNALAGAAVGLAAGMPLGRIVGALAGGWSAPHRGQLVRAGSVTIVDDAYNASPASVAAALELLAGLPGRPVAILGEMLELGTDEEAEAGHREVGAVAAARVERLITVGPGAAAIAEGARAAGMAPDRIVEAADRDDATARAAAILAPGDVVLVKASRGVALEVLIDGLVQSLGSAGA